MIVQCDFCNSEIEKYECNVNDNNFCDNSCRGNWLSENRNGEDHPNYSKIKVECSFCNSTFKRQKREVENSDNNFCNRECYDSWKKENALSGEEHPLYDGPGICVKCSNCSSEKFVSEKRVEEQDNFYCDGKCQVEDQGIPERWGNEGERVEKVCEWCDITFEVFPYRSDTAKFCSKGCVSSWLSKNNSGENHVQYEDYKENYGRDWPSERRKARRYYQNECQVCITEFDGGEKIPVHHIIPVSSFKKKNDAHFQKNLVQVCRGCHFKLEYSSVDEQIDMLEDTKYYERHGSSLLKGEYISLQEVGQTGAVPSKIIEDENGT